MTMPDQIENRNESKNYVELSEEQQIFKKIQEELNSVQDKLLQKSETEITVDEAKSELQKINEWIQWSNLESQDKEKIWNAFEKLAKLENNIDKNTIKKEVDEIINLLETLTQNDLATLKWNVQQNKLWRNPERPVEVQQWIDQSSNNLASTIHEASQDKNPIARNIGKRMEYLMS